MRGFLGTSRGEEADATGNLSGRTCPGFLLFGHRHRESGLGLFPGQPSDAFFKFRKSSCLGERRSLGLGVPADTLVMRVCKGLALTPVHKSMKSGFRSMRSPRRKLLFPFWFQYVKWANDKSLGGIEGCLAKLKAADPTFGERGSLGSRVQLCRGMWVLLFPGQLEWGWGPGWR